MKMFSVPVIKKLLEKKNIKKLLDAIGFMQGQ